VYIAAAPLYRAKLGNQEFYFEKDAQLEDLLARERIPQVDVLDRAGTEVKLTETKWRRFARELPQFEGYSARLRSDFGAPAAELMVRHRLVEHEIEEPEDFDRAIAEIGANGYELTVVDRDDDAFRVRVVETETSTARNVRLPVELLASPIYSHVRAEYARLAALVGLPPFTVKVGKETATAETFEALRVQVLEAAKAQGMQLSRFKGLGEMNPEQLWETTMDPAKRLLIRVDVEDAHATAEIFSKLMGDAVEPRREFIEQNAKDVKFLDV
jgi:DNA gyrase subunit B